MKEFTGFEYLLIDAANNHHSDLDKETFEARILWGTENLATLENEAKDRIWKNRPLYIKAVMAIRKAQQGIPTGHLVGFDAICSGAQIMSALTGCISGAKATGLIDPDRRADAYTECTKLMAVEMGTGVSFERKDVKQAVMTALYGSKKEPKKVFGVDTPELEAFHKALYKMAPGACQLLEDLLQSWQPNTLSHAWKLPDGYTAFVKVMQRKEHRIEVDELNHSTFTYVYYENEGEKKGVKNVANVVHSIDGYILRSLIRRCNYDDVQVPAAANAIEAELLQRGILRIEGGDKTKLNHNPEAQYYIEQFERSGIADVVIVPYLDVETIHNMEKGHLRGLNQILNTMIKHKSFEIVTIHDCFCTHPNNVNEVRRHYTNILADLAESTLLSSIFTQLHGTSCTYKKLSQNLGDIIRQSNYALS